MIPSGLLWNERRCDDLAVDAQLRELPVQSVAGWAGFVADLEILAASQLLDELAHGLGPIGELAKAADLPATFGDSRADGFSVNIQTELSSTIAHGRLLRCGSASCVSCRA